VTFNAGQTSKTVNVSVNGDTLPSSDRIFTLGIYAATAPSSITRSSGTALIIENQVSNRVSVGPDVAVIKGDSGTQTAVFTVSLNAPQLFPVQVDYATQDGSAHAPESYAPAADTLTFNPGQTTKSVSVTVNSNTFILPTEYFTLVLANAQNSTIGASTATAFIYDADVFNVKGSVVDQSGAGVAGATVTRTGNNQPTVTATTAANGSFTIANSLGGTYTIKPTLAGKTFLPVSTSVTVLGADVTGQNFLGYVAGATTVTGLVESTAGLGGVTVTRTGGSQPTATATTTSLGYFAFVGLPVANGYVFTPTLAAYVFNPTSVTANINGTTTLAMFDMVAVQATYITGRVTKGGNGIAGATITRSGGSQPTATVKTNSQGYYGFSNVPVVVANRTYTITPTATGKTFTPTSLNAVVNTTTNATGVDFVEN
jgi:Calx-beta domain/Carboxypeptidase regulatory-like domain